jgi:isoamylase
MTLHDLHAFNGRENALPFPQGPSPGGRSAQEEMCWDHGGDPVAVRQAVRTSAALLLLSAGTPMLQGGSEIDRTQSGNNNAFNLDTIANWIDWGSAAAEAPLTTFVTRLLAFRRAYSCLRRAAFYTGAVQAGSGLEDIAWYRDDGAEVDQGYFANPTNHFLAFRIDATATGDPAGSVYVAYNGWTAPIQTLVPAPGQADRGSSSPTPPPPQRRGATCARMARTSRSPGRNIQRTRGLSRCSSSADVS